IRSRLDPAEVARSRNEAERTNGLVPVAAHLTGDELGQPQSTNGLRKLALDYARTNFLGQTITNIETGMPIQFNMVGLKKATSLYRGPDLLRLVPAIPKMLEHGRYLLSESDLYGRQDIMAVHVFASAAELRGARCPVILFVRQTRDGK